MTDAQSLTNFKLRARATMAVFKTFTAVTSEAIRFSVEKSASNPCDSSLDAFDRGCNLRSARQSCRPIRIDANWNSDCSAQSRGERGSLDRGNQLGRSWDFVRVV